MKRRFAGFAVAAMLGLAGVGTAVLTPVSIASATGAAVLQTRTFTIGKMTCAGCPITVKTALKRVAGVRSVDVDFASSTATVTFDPAVTSADRIARASTDVGYPANLRSATP